MALQKFSKICVSLDIETTDLDPRKGEIIEIAAVKFKNKKIIDKYQSLINPNKKIPSIIQSITGISDSDVERAPVIGETIKDFQNFVGDHAIVGHNIEFDINFLNHKGFNFKNKKYDTWKLAVILLPNLSSHSLEMLTSFFRIKHINSHRALADALASADLFNILVKKIYQLDLNVLKSLVKALKDYQWPLSDIFNEVYKKRPKEKAAPLKKSAKTEEPQKKNKKNLEAVEKVFKRQIKIKKIIKEYEYRSEQVQLIKQLLENFEKKENCFITAPPGLGKDVAYLTSAAYFSQNFDDNVYICLENFNKLQEMISNSLGVIRQILNLNIKHSILLAPESYICRRRFNHYLKTGKLDQAELNFMVKIMLWLPNTATGIFRETAWLYEDQIYENKINCRLEHCLQKQCQYHKDCFYFKALFQSKGSDLVLGDHNSFFFHFFNQSQRKIKNIILDRAYNLEANFQNYYAVMIDNDKISALLKNLQKNINELIKHPTDSVRGKKLKAKARILQAESGRIEDKTALYFGILGIALAKQPAAYGRKRIAINKNTPQLSTWLEIKKATENYIFQINGLIVQLDSMLKLLSAKKYKDTAGEMGAWSLELYKVINNMQKILLLENLNQDVWLEDCYGKPLINIRPRGIPDKLMDEVINRSNSFNLVVSMGNIPKIKNFLLKELKISREIKNISIETQQPAEKNIKLLAPIDAPHPNSSDFGVMAGGVIRDIALKLKDGVIVSASSQAALKKIYQGLAPEMKKNRLKVFAQGITGGKDKAYSQFVGQKSIYMASHHTIMDKEFSASKIKCLIMLKFPFEMASVNGAEADFSAQKDRFETKTLPSAVFKYIKIFQKIVKNSKKGRTVFINLDNRLLNANYGDDFIKALPKMGIQYVETKDIPKAASEWLGV